MAVDRNERIERRAYEIWESEGRPDGSDLRHWQQACDELDGDDLHETPQDRQGIDDRGDAALLQGAGESGDINQSRKKFPRSKKTPKGLRFSAAPMPEIEITTGEKPSRQKIKKTEGP
ncbi:DUF2934 domain-containing protein [Rhizobium calliandrae]|uniref:DUF2934 domain-containing protein n=1 Tax=Rhizobium calliandrae TaxID=1312182 RepID=A0ABT7KRU2_9HYPH|nr:DUF2934 domain-containing protein [Rhizobium calliandrae]MDL2410825.1 DUF2934 domain-containing protein [Rhizobium calliandrae]